ncbi:hypothetical protein PTSG_12061 [Salpingoeca rosetta]|uniref:Ribosome-binding factor A n=1 Tax=Salpingoeca rosetta (strain ATCC 50818 / BSB-021) TaxID=946362 RepID=F2U6C2_SALR5|nr:uncharacterized protein PTSG_12061 [Salpingoeca rosetta]EGD83063.1 hypothetical protein PTSG_12061 [Salpingoeca rosetta]|eukprot:XP_004995427.1 hypothetical protein PTSG_12061 [Salpingoeca rosetta]
MMQHVLRRAVSVRHAGAVARVWPGQGMVDARLLRTSAGLQRRRRAPRPAIPEELMKEASEEDAHMRQLQQLQQLQQLRQEDDGSADQLLQGLQSMGSMSEEERQEVAAELQRMSPEERAYLQLSMEQMEHYFKVAEQVNQSRDAEREQQLRAKQSRGRRRHAQPDSDRGADEHGAASDRVASSAGVGDSGDTANDVTGRWNPTGANAASAPAPAPVPSKHVTVLDPPGMHDSVRLEVPDMVPNGVVPPPMDIDSADELGHSAKHARKRRRSAHMDDDDEDEDEDDDDEGEGGHDMEDLLQSDGRRGGSGTDEVPVTEVVFSLGKPRHQRRTKDERWEGSARYRRVTDAIGTAIEAAIYRHHLDPLLVKANITIYDVHVKRSFRKATVYWTATFSEDPELQAEQEAAIAEVFVARTRELRRMIAGSLPLKHTPALEFKRSMVDEEEARLEALLREGLGRPPKPVHIALQEAQQHAANLRTPTS